MIIFRKNYGVILNVLSCLFLMEGAVNAWTLDRNTGPIQDNIAKAT